MKAGRVVPINAANLRSVHALIESQTAVGKIVLEGVLKLKENRSPNLISRRVQVKVKPVAVVIPHEKFRDEELFLPLDVWKALDVPWIIASTRVGESVGDLGGRAEITHRIDQLDTEEYSAIVVVGGSGTAAHLWGDVGLQGAVRDFAEAGKLVAAICAGAIVLARSGVMKGRSATTYPVQAMIDALKSAGVPYSAEGVVIHGDTITASGPEQARDFGVAIAEALRRDSAVVVISAVLHAYPSMERKLESCLLEMLDPVGGEDDTLEYRIHRALDNPGRFFFYEKYRNRIAVDAHMATAHFQKLLGKLDGLIAQPPEIILHREIGAIRRES